LITSQAAGQLRDILVRARYGDAINASGDEEVRLRRAVAGSPGWTLVSLFHAGHPTPVEHISETIDALLLQELLEADVLRREGDAIVSAYRIAASDGLLVVHDPSPPTRADHVMGVNPAARTLASLTIREPVETALDVCTGCGYQALLLARHAERVVATDILPRALSLTRLNAALNGVANIECRTGDFFEPVAGERFDLVVCNPPFVISPDSEYAFRDAGLRGDAVSAIMLKSVCAHLNDGGFASVLVNSGLEDDEPWDARGKGWLVDAGCDATFLRWSVSDPLTYTAIWNAHLAQLDRKAYTAALDRWPEYLHGLGFTKIAEMGVIMHRRAGTNWIAAFEAAAGPSGDATRQLLNIFAAQHFLVDQAKELLDRRFRLIEGHQIDQAMLFAHGSYEIPNATLHLPAGAGLTGAVPANLIPLLFNLSAGSLREVASSFARQMDLNPAAVLEDASAMVRQLFGSGLLEMTG